MIKLKIYFIYILQLFFVILFSSSTLDVPKKRPHVEDSIRLLQNQLVIASREGDVERIIELHKEIALLYADNMRYSDALNMFNDALQLSERHNYTDGVFMAYNNIGVLHCKSTMYASSIDYYYKALEIAEQNEDLTQKNTVLNNLGVVFSILNDKKKALSFFLDALSLSEQSGHAIQSANNSTNIGSVFMNMNEWSNALEFFAKAEKIYTEEGDLRNLAAALSNIAAIYAMQERFSESESYFTRSHELLKQEKDSYTLSESLYDYAHMLLGLGNYKQAKEKYFESFEVAKHCNNLQVLANVCFDLNLLFTDQDDFDKAYEYLSLHTQYKDSLLVRTKQSISKQSQLSFDLSKREKEVNKLEQEATYKTIIWSAITIFCLLMLLFLWLWGKERIQKLKHESHLKQLKVEKTEQDKEKLKRDIELKEEINRLTEDKLRGEIDYKSRELATVAMHMVSKNDMLMKLQKELESISSEKMDQSSRSSVLNLKAEIQRNLKVDHDWENFKLHFEQVHPHFFEQVSLKYPKLNTSDTRMCAYLLMGLDSKEIAQLFNINPDSVRKRRQRLREKLSLKSTEDIKSLLLNELGNHVRSI